MIKKYFQLIGFLAFMMFAVFSIADIAREDRDFYKQSWGEMSFKEIETNINNDLIEMDKWLVENNENPFGLHLEIVESKDYGLVFNFIWLKSECKDGLCYFQDRRRGIMYEVDVVGYVVSSEKHKNIEGVIGFCYEEYENLVIVLVPFDFCREANKRALECNTIKKLVEYEEWLYEAINIFRTGEERYLNQSTPQKGVIV